MKCCQSNTQFRPEATLVKVAEMPLTKVVNASKMLVEISLKLVP